MFFQALKNRIKNPIGFLRGKAAREPVRRETLYGVITLGIIALLNIGTVLRASIAVRTKKDKSNEECTKLELWECEELQLKKPQPIGNIVER